MHALQLWLRHNDHDSDCFCGVPSLFCRMVQLEEGRQQAQSWDQKGSMCFWRLMNENKKVQLHRLQQLFDCWFDSLFDCLLVCRFVIGLLVCWFVSSFACLLAWHQRRCQTTFIPRVHLEYVAISCFGTCLMKMMTMMMTNMTMTMTMTQISWW